MGSLSAGYLKQIGEEVIGNSVGVFADESAFVGADGVEVAKQQNREIRIRSRCIDQDPFVHVFGPTVGIRTGCGHVFGYRHGVVVTVDCSRRTEYEFGDVVFFHHFQKCQSGIDVVAIVL